MKTFETAIGSQYLRLTRRDNGELRLQMWNWDTQWVPIVDTNLSVPQVDNMVASLKLNPDSKNGLLYGGGGEYPLGSGDIPA